MEAGAFQERAGVALDGAIKAVFGFLLAVFPLIYGWAPVDAGGDTTISQSLAVTIFEAAAGALALLMGLKLCVAASPQASSGGNGASGGLHVAAAAFTAICALQFLPLPPAIHAFVTPSGSDLLDRFAGIAPSDARTTTLIPSLTFVAFLKVAAFFIVFFVASKLPRSRGDLRLFLGAVTAAGALTAFLGLIKFFAGDALSFLFPSGGGHDRAAGPFINPNHFAGYLEICFPLTLAFFILSGPMPERGMLNRPALSEYARTHGWKKALIGFACLLMAGGMISSLSRLGIFAFALSIFTFFFVLFRGRRSKLVLGIAVFASFAAVLLTSIYVGLDPLLQRYSILEDAGVNRLDAWKMGARMTASFPLTGSGLGTFRYISPLYQPPELKGGFHQAHNDYVNIAADAGLPALAAALVFLVLWTRHLLGVAGLHGSFRPVAAAGFVAAMAAMAVHSIGDFNLQVASNGMLFAMVLGVGAALGRAAQADSSGTGAHEPSR